VRFPPRTKTHSAGFARYEIGIAGFAGTASELLGETDSGGHSYFAGGADVALSQLWI